MKPGSTRRGQSASATATSRGHRIALTASGAREEDSLHGPRRREDSHSRRSSCRRNIPSSARTPSPPGGSSSLTATTRTCGPGRIHRRSCSRCRGIPATTVAFRVAAARPRNTDALRWSTCNARDLVQRPFPSCSSRHSPAAEAVRTATESRPWCRRSTCPPNTLRARTWLRRNNVAWRCSCATWRPRPNTRAHTECRASSSRPPLRKRSRSRRAGRMRRTALRSSNSTSRRMRYPSPARSSGRSALEVEEEARPSRWLPPSRTQDHGLRSARPAQRRRACPSESTRARARRRPRDPFGATSLGQRAPPRDLARTDTNSTRPQDCTNETTRAYCLSRLPLRLRSETLADGEASRR